MYFSWEYIKIPNYTVLYQQEVGEKLVTKFDCHLQVKIMHVRLLLKWLSFLSLFTFYFVFFLRFFNKNSKAMKILVWNTQN